MTCVRASRTVAYGKLAYGKPTMENRHMANWYMAKRHHISASTLLSQLLDVSINVQGPFDSDRSRSKIFDLGQVSHLWFGFRFGKFPLKMSNFSVYFPSGQKKYLGVWSKSTWVEGESASHLLRVKRMLGSGPISTLWAILYISRDGLGTKIFKQGWVILLRVFITDSFDISQNLWTFFIFHSFWIMAASPWQVRIRHSAKT